MMEHRECSDCRQILRRHTFPTDEAPFCTNCLMVRREAKYVEDRAAEATYQRLKFGPAEPEPPIPSTGRRQKTPRERRDYALRYSYNMTIEEYEARSERQGGLCGACRMVPERGLVVDHCHRTDRNRALLCNGCNTALGMLGEDPVRIQRLKEYAELHKRIDAGERPRNAFGEEVGFIE